MLKIVFMGSPEFAVPSLEVLHSSSHEIQAVVSNPDKRRGRGGGTSPTSVKKRALELGYRVITTESTKAPDFVNELAELKPDLLVVVAFRILPPEVLKIPRLGSINLHASLLPKYRGAAPIHWAVINGERETGCTVFFLDEQVDTGRIICKSKTGIGSNETTGELYERLKVLGADLLAEAIEKIDKGEAEAIPQDELQASPAPKLFSKDTGTDFTKPATDVHNWIRGLSPFPVATAEYGDQKVNLYRSRVGPDFGMEPGKLAGVQESLLVGCGSGTVELLELQMPGKRKISGKDFINGYDLSIKFR